MRCYNLKFNKFVCLRIHSSRNRRHRWRGSSGKTGLCLCSFTSSSCVSWILYKWRSKQSEIDLLGFSCILSRNQWPCTQSLQPLTESIQFLCQLNFVKVQIKVTMRTFPSYGLRKARSWKQSEIDLFRLSCILLQKQWSYMHPLQPLTESMDSNLSTRLWIVFSVGW